jgi:hypothetical protein
VGKPEGRVHLEDLCVSGDTIKMNTKEIGWDMDWINLASIKCREFISRTLLHVIG